MGKVTGLLALLGFWTLLVAQASIIKDQAVFTYRESTLPAGEQTYIVHMQTPDPSVTVSTLGTPLSTYTRLLLDVQQRAGMTVNSDGSLSPPRVPIHVYERVLSGFSARLTSTEVQLLRNSNGVLGVYSDRVRRIQTTRTPEFLGLNTLLGLWPQAHFGDDVIIGVLDTGIWPERESFSDAGYGPIPTRWNGTCQTGTDWNTTNCNKKLIGARYFYAGYEQATGAPLNETLESKSARDIKGHGTHTASTAAGSPVEGASLYGFANGTARGMAPRARIAVYKICWLNGCFDSDILAAFEFAIADGVDVISLSVGRDPDPYEVDSIAIAGFAAMQRGIFVSCSAGNSGPNYGTVSNAAPWLMTVAASTLDRKSGACVLELGDTFNVAGQSMWHKGNTSFPVPPNGLIYGRDAAKDNVTAATYCIVDSLDASVRGKVVLCMRGENGRIKKGAVVSAAGGIGMILINTPLFDEVTVADLHLLPAIHVSYSEGIRLAAYMNTTAAAAPLTFNLKCVEQLGVTPAPATAIFSSRGPNIITPEVLKPDITAPGVSILAAWTGHVGPTSLSFDQRVVDFNLLSGTSMSCPHVTGVAALLKSAHPEWSPAAIKSAMMTSASISDNTDNFITDSYTGFPGVPWEFGSGLVMPQSALDPGLVYDIGAQDYVNFLCALEYNATTLRMFTGEAVTCPPVPVRLEDMNYPSLSAVFRQAPSLTLLSMNMTRTLTNVANASATYIAKIFAPPGFIANVVVDPAVLTFSGINDRKSFSVQVSTVNIPDATLVGMTLTDFAYLVWFDGVTRNVVSPISVTHFK